MPEGKDPVTVRELWEHSEQVHERTEARLRRLEIVVALIAAYAFGQGGASLLSRFT